MGADLHEVIVQLNPVASDGSWLKRVEDVAKPFYQNRLRKEIPYKFTILDSDEVNAFSHPGGYVYLTRGLFDLIGEDEDYALQFAVGHEIAHVDLGHAIKCLQDPDITKMNGGTLRKLYWVIIPFGYLVSETVNQDYEADEWVPAGCGTWVARSAKPSPFSTSSTDTRPGTVSETARQRCVWTRFVLARYPLPEADGRLAASGPSEGADQVTSSLAFRSTTFPRSRLRPGRRRSCRRKVSR